MTQHLPTLHLSIRVPWHDSSWNGKICNSPRNNASCMILERVSQEKNIEFEENNSGKFIHELEENNLPPCISERVSFMSKFPVTKKVSHPYSHNKNNDRFYKHFEPTDLKYPGFSFSVVPYNWMLKDPETNTSKKAIDLNLNFKREREPALEFKNIWVQQFDNQKALLDAFIKPIIPNESLVFIYSKNIPFIDTTERILIGVGNISKIGELTEYKYKNKINGDFRSVLWERPVYHTIREDFQNGFLLPYQELIEHINNGNVVNIQDYIAYAPTFEEFSYGSEWVTNDSAIESILILKEKLIKFQQLLPGKNYSAQLEWIDNQLSRIWKLRGPFPGLGAVLTGLKIAGGNFIAWEIDKLIRSKLSGEIYQDPWLLVDQLIYGNKVLIDPNLLKGINNTVTATWKTFTDIDKEFFKLLSRMNLNNDQVVEIIDLKKSEKIKILENPYLLYENFKDLNLGFSPTLIDKIFFGSDSFLKNFPLYHLTNIDSPLDSRRIRALAILILEQNALEGNSILFDFQMVTCFSGLPIHPPCNPSVRNLIAISDFLSDEIVIHNVENKDEEYYFKLRRLEKAKNIINSFVETRINNPILPIIESDWEEIINLELKPIDRKKPEWFQMFEMDARLEKANALEVLSNNRFSILIGPAGTGKTTLLNIFCSLPHIMKGSVLKLAPTGKARVNMGKNAKTLAQFLISTERYDPSTGKYFLRENAKRFSFDTVILDECSMITEEQLSTLIDSLSNVKRFIMIGDYRQLPPIGTGRPFVDIFKYLKDQNKSMAILKRQFRQYTDTIIPEEPKERLDIRLAKWFSDDEIRRNDEDIFEEIANNKNKKWKNISFIEWFNTKDLAEKMKKATDDEINKILGNSRTEDFAVNFDLSLGGFQNGKFTNFNLNSAKSIENWQLITPNRTQGYGTKMLNLIYQQNYRSKILNAINRMSNLNRTLPHPVGEDNIVYGDKVINNSNIKWSSVYPRGEEANKYIANGELGIHIGSFGELYKTTKKVNIAFSSQLNYSYQFYENHFGEESKVNMELGYSITIHKSQGSGFKTVICVLPNPCPILSRELLYTALTRQKERIVILHQGNFTDYRKFIRDEYSETSKRFTDLFYQPIIKSYKKKYYDNNYIQVSENGEFMISKSEVIIADKLKHYNISYTYEAPLQDESGFCIHPDFTIEDKRSGVIYYWEHLGMLTLDSYRSKWDRKKEFYEKNGIYEVTDKRQSAYKLIITRDKPDGGIDSQEIKNIIFKNFIV